MTRLLAAAASDPGRVRTSNQDRALVVNDLLVIADGMGGHAGGEVAARTAVEALERAFAQNASAEGLIDAAFAANREVFERAEREQALRGMGTTLTAAALIDGDAGDDARVALVNVGDSRAYLFEEGSLVQLTEDHSLVEEMVRRGELPPEAALTHPHRHILTRALGIDPGVEIDSWLLAPSRTSRLLLCSDGLTNECTEEEIAGVLAEGTEPEAAAQELVTRALAHGGNDNITVIVADFEDSVAAKPVDEQNDEGAVPPPSAAPEDANRPELALVAPVHRRRGTAALAPRRSRRGSAHLGPAPAAATDGARTGTRRRGDRVLTLRVALFSILLVGVLGGIAGFVVWFNRATYFVGIENGHVAVFEGRPGGFLWFKPALVEQTSLSTSAVVPAELPTLRAGILESSVQAARGVVSDLAKEQSLIGLVPVSTPVTPTTTKSAISVDQRQSAFALSPGSP